MKFKIIIAKLPTKDLDGNKFHVPRQELEMDGELDAVKTFLKLSVDIESFDWGAVERLDELQTGDVSRWMIRRNWTNGTLELTVFSFHNVDPLININACLGSFETKPGMKAVNKILGGGVF